jgi:hypothetical protein
LKRRIMLPNADPYSADLAPDKLQLAVTAREPDREAIKTFVGAIFRHVGTEGYVSLRAFHEGEERPFRITPVSLQGGLEFLCEAAEDDASRAANAPQEVVFCPPLSIFTSRENAKQINLLKGPALSVECDQRAREAAATLEKLLGPATVIVRSGGLWTDPVTKQVQDKLHLHYRLAKPAQGEDLARLKRARVLATEIVGGDASNKPTVHPIRWPGSWHRKGEPKLCKIEVLNPEAEIDLNVALAALEAAAPKKAKAKTNGKVNSKNHEAGEGWAALIQKILTAESFHEPLASLAMKMLKAGMSDGAAVNMLRGLMKNATGDRDTRWQARVNDIPRAISTAREKVGEGSEGSSPAVERPIPSARCSLDELHCVFRKWFGDEYDLDAIDAVIVTGAAARMDGDPLWLLIVSGPGAAKTETAQALAGCGAHVTSTIQSEGALLSATSQQERSKKATGGLLRKIGARGILVLKDVTTILSSDRNTRATVLAALREIHDGHYERNVGSDGGQTLTWDGRIAVVGAVTTAWDSAHAVVSVMGDRFVLLRIDSGDGRKAAGKRAMRNTGVEVRMRAELAAAVGGIVHHADTEGASLTEAEEDQVLNAADIVTKARTAVEFDYRGDVVNSHAPEMPTRFAKQLVQMIRGGIAVGMSRERAMELAIRCARDSIPPLRRDILLDVAANPDTNPGDARKRLNKPWSTVKREMQALNMLGILHCDEDLIRGYGEGKDKTVWKYRLAPGFDRTTLLAMAGKQQEEKNDDDDVTI